MLHIMGLCVNMSNTSVDPRGLNFRSDHMMNYCDRRERSVKCNEKRLSTQENTAASVVSAIAPKHHMNMFKWVIHQV